MTRMHRSVYFDVCCYVWDQNQPCPESEMRLMLGDVEGWRDILQDLIDSDKLVRFEDGSVTNLRAEAEAQRAFDLWERKSAGGKKGAAATNVRKASAVTPERTPDDTPDRTAAKSPDETGPGVPTQNQNQNQNQKLSPNGDCASGDALKPEHVVETWNEIAPRIGRPKVRDLTPERRQLVKARIAQYSLDDFKAVFDKVARSPFLRGDLRWKGATFDWIIKKGNFQKIIEGNYDD